MEIQPSNEVRKNEAANEQDREMGRIKGRSEEKESRIRFGTNINFVWIVGNLLQAMSLKKVLKKVLILKKRRAQSVVWHLGNSGFSKCTAITRYIVST